MSFASKHNDYLEPPDEGPSQAIAEALHDDRTIKGHGRRQHGLNGRDADLDPAGQVSIEDIRVLDPVGAEDMALVANVQAYASVCEPTLDSDEQDSDKEEQLRDIATEIVCDACAFAGEWTGSDYWSFHHDYTVSVPMTVDEYDAGLEEHNLETLAARLVQTIYTHPETKKFEKFAVELNKQLDELQKEFNKCP